MKLVIKMLKHIVGETLQSNSRHTRKHSHRVLPHAIHLDSVHHLWQRKCAHPRWLLKSIIHDGEDVDRGEKEISKSLEWSDEAVETGGHGVGLDGAAFGFGVGRGGHKASHVVAIVVCGAQNDEKFE